MERSLLVGSRRARLQHRVMRLLLRARSDVNLLEKPSAGAKGKAKPDKGRCSPLMLLCSSPLPSKFDEPINHSKAMPDRTARTHQFTRP